MSTTQKTTFEEKPKVSGFQRLTWNVLKAFSKPLMRGDGQVSLKEQLWQLEANLRKSKMYRLKAVTLMVCCALIPYEMRRTMEDGNPQRDNIYSLVTHTMERSKEKREKIDQLYKRS